MDTVDKVLSKGHLVQMYIQKVRTQKPILWTAERRISRASCPLTVCVQHLLILFVSHSFIMSHYFSNGQQRPAAAIHPAATFQHGWQIMHMHHVSTISFCLRFEVQPTWSAIGSISTMACVAAFSPSSLESELELGEGYKPVTTAIQKTVACKNDATKRWADLAKQAQ